MTKTPVAVASYPAVVGAVLLARRKELGLSQSNLADAVGLTVSTWSRIENGESALTIEQLAAAAQALGVAPSALLQVAEEKIAELNRRGIATSPTRIDPASIVELGAIPLIGASLSGALGPIAWLASSAVSGYRLYSKFAKRKG
jgi:transcriptional regulator with XRE-family HTH domain